MVGSGRLLSHGLFVWLGLGGNSVSHDVSTPCHTCCAQGWSSASVRTVQLCVACNMPYLDMNYNLAPEAVLDNGALLVCLFWPRLCVAVHSRQCRMTLFSSRSWQLDACMAGVWAVAYCRGLGSQAVFALRNSAGRRLVGCSCQELCTVRRLHGLHVDRADVSVGGAAAHDEERKGRAPADGPPPAAEGDPAVCVGLGA